MPEAEIDNMKTTMIYLRQLLALCVVMVAFAACGDDEKNQHQYIRKYTDIHRSYRFAVHKPRESAQRNYRKYLALCVVMVAFAACGDDEKNEGGSSSASGIQLNTIVVLIQFKSRSITGETTCCSSIVIISFFISINTFENILIR